MMPSMIIHAATGNQDKVRELQSIFSSHTLTAAEQFSCLEDGDTFFANAYKKALCLHAQCGQTVLADDSGLCVPALGGAPGIFSARYGSDRFARELSSEERNAYLLSQLDAHADRRAFFVCAIVLLFDPHRYLSVQETVAGSITQEPRGSGGFGYDPVFFLPEFGCTMAELTEEEKHAISHRGKAGRLLSRMLHVYETQEHIP